MPLTLEQVLENNAVAKDYLRQVIEAIEKLEFRKEALKTMKWYERFVCSSVGYENRAAIEMALRTLKLQLTLYFHMHYTNGGQLSKYISPDVSYEVHNFGLIWDEITTCTLVGIPHPIKK